MFSMVEDMLPFKLVTFTSNQSPGPNPNSNPNPNPSSEARLARGILDMCATVEAAQSAAQEATLATAKGVTERTQLASLNSMGHAGNVDKISGITRIGPVIKANIRDRIGLGLG